MRTTFKQLGGAGTTTPQVSNNATEQRGSVAAPRRHSFHWNVQYLRRSFKSLGGPGSGNFGHAGRPGEVGGSAEGGDDLIWIVAKMRADSEGFLSSAEAKRLASSLRDPLGSWYAMRSYWDHGSASMNKALRAGRVPKGAKLIDEFIAAKSDSPDVLWRGGVKPSVIKSWKVGQEVKDLAYMSTSASRDTAQTFGDDVLIKITAAKGIGARSPAWDWEKEVTLPRNLPLKVVAIKPFNRGGDYRDGILVEAQVVSRRGSKFKSLGGVGSGNFGHAGRPGEVGGSAEGGSFSDAMKRVDLRTWNVTQVTVAQSLNVGLDEMFRLGVVFARTADKLGHLPSLNEFAQEWGVKTNDKQQDRQLVEKLLKAPADAQARFIEMIRDLLTDQRRQLKDSSFKEITDD